MKRPLLLAARWSRSKGFGVQSPFAYKFVTTLADGRAVTRNGENVFRHLESEWQETHGQRRLHRFYARLARWLLPDTWGGNHLSTACKAYIKAGWPQVRIMSREDTAEAMVICLASGSEADSGSFYEQAVAAATGKTVLIIEDIHRDKQARLMWNRLKADSRSAQAFDLYQCGVAFFDQTKTKGH